MRKGNIERKRKKNRNEFIRNFRLKPEYVTDLMKRSDVSPILLRKHYITDTVKKPAPVKFTDEEYKEFLLDQLKKSVQLMNTNKSNIRMSFLYDPEVIEIHNESIEEKEGPTIQELKAQESSIATKTLRRQETRLIMQDVMKTYMDKKMEKRR